MEWNTYGFQGMYLSEATWRHVSCIGYDDVDQLTTQKKSTENGYLIQWETRYTVCRRPWCFQYMAWIFLSFESVFPLVFGVHAAARLFSAQFHWYSRFASAILLCFMTKVRFLWTRKLLAFWHFDLDLQIFLKFFQKVLWFEGTLTSTPTPNPGILRSIQHVCKCKER